MYPILCIADERGASMPNLLLPPPPFLHIKADLIEYAEYALAFYYMVTLICDLAVMIEWKVDDENIPPMFVTRLILYMNALLFLIFIIGLTIISE